MELLCGLRPGRSGFSTEFFIITLKSKQPQAELMTEDHTDHLQG